MAMTNLAHFQALVQCAAKFSLNKITGTFFSENFENLQFIVNNIQK